MTRPQVYDLLQIQEVRNPKVQLSEADRAAFKRLRERRFSRMEKEHAILRAARPAEDILALRKATYTALAEAIPDYANRRKDILEKLKPRFDKIRPETLDLPIIELELDYDHGVDDLDTVFRPPPPPPPEGIGELWWAQTAFFSSMGEITIDVPDEFVHIFGHLHWGGDSLLTGSVGYTEDYVLSPDRFPSTSKTALDIRTELRIKGILSGFTGLYHPLWNADDKWCKCWQITRQTASLSTGQVLSNRVLPLQMIDLDNVDPVGQANPDLTGGQAELLQFDVNLGALAASGTSIHVQIETRYDIQLEGDADIWFRRFGGSASESVPSMQNAVLFRSDPMILKPR